MRCDLTGIEKYLQHVSTHCQELLVAMLKQDPEQRLSATEALGHSWFQCDKDIIRDLIQLNEFMCDDNAVKQVKPKYKQESEGESED